MGVSSGRGNGPLASDAADHARNGRRLNAMPRRAARARVAYRQMPAATETFRLSTVPPIGMPTMRSQDSRVRRRRPCAFGAQHPRHRAARRRRRTGSRRRCRRRGSRRPAPSARAIARARLVTVTTGTVSAAPLAAFATVALTPTARSFGHDDRVRAERVGVAQARAEVVRVGDAVEHQQQRRLAQALEHVVERDVRRRRRRRAPPRPGGAACPASSRRRASSTACSAMPAALARVVRSRMRASWRAAAA